MNRIGILGGMGPAATQYFLGRLIEIFGRLRKPSRDQEFPDMTLRMECSIPDRTAEIRAGGRTAFLRIEESLQQLHDAGCRPICIPCVSAHALVDPKWFAMSVLDIRRGILSHASQWHGKSVGVLATDGALASRVLEPLLENFDLVIPSDNVQGRIMSTIHGLNGLKSGSMDVDTCSNELTHAVHHLRDKGADCLLAGCTEIEMFVSSHDITEDFILPMESLCIDATQIVAFQPNPDTVDSKLSNYVTV